MKCPVCWTITAVDRLWIVARAQEKLKKQLIGGRSNPASGYTRAIASTGALGSTLVPASQINYLNGYES